MSFVRFSTATFRSVASSNLIGACSREAQVPSSMKATARTTRSWSSVTARTTRSWSSVVLDQKEDEKQIDGSDKIAKADGMGDADQVDDPMNKFRNEDFLQRSWEEGRVREVFQEWKEAYERVYANAEEEEMRFKIF
ncbi:uncharacterized protein LOC120010770 [Tripterygium wilfordii]|uniref:uncharacterized protein LOC120010770 n=1 Tax=Tripterygium wilfordii TaxID=458696 RepID=UPI0018F8374B|nr:uncharacterized protein LOC120010770 [Tripterygium wilfordii]